VGFAIWLLGFVLLASPVAAQTTDAWDTNTLVNIAHNLTAPDLDRVRQQASVGDARSQALLGLVYEMGAAGVMADPVQALSWFTRAAEQGIAWAEIWAGDFYYTGSTGVPKDLYKAVELYKSAAEHGSPAAAFYVGRMYFFGEGVAMNMAEAARWFHRAIPADAELVGKMIALSEGACAEPFCVALRQILGAMTTESAGQYAGEWNDETHEWAAVKELRDFERCGFTSSDRTDQGDVQNYFCDSEVIVDAVEGARLASALADDVERALAPGWTRSAETANQPNVYFFLRDGFPRVRVSYNRTLGDAPQRVTLLVGP
jgi:hypothetical protein